MASSREAATDALVLKVREGGRVVAVHALVATGVNAKGTGPGRPPCTLLRFAQPTGRTKCDSRGRMYNTPDSPKTNM